VDECKPLGDGAARARAHQGRPRDADGSEPHGWVVQVDPIKRMLIAPGTQRLKLKCYILLSNSAFKFNLSRYNMGHFYLTSKMLPTILETPGRGLHSFTLELNSSSFSTHS